MTQTTHGKGSIITFHGKSGTRYPFQAWPMDTRFKPRGGIYIVTKRECLNRTFAAMATHRCLAIGQTADFAASVPLGMRRGTVRPTARLSSTSCPVPPHDAFIREEDAYLAADASGSEPPIDTAAFAVSCL
jgi:hypothetical protein